MPNYERAAQFAPYAALSGYDGAVRETARLTQTRIELDDYEIAKLDGLLKTMAAKLSQIFSVTYFIQDKRKTGGEYISVAVRFGKFDELNGVLITSDGLSIPVRDIIAIEEINPTDIKA